MFHFTPVLKLGGSQSNSSDLEDQLELQISSNELSGKKVALDDVGKFTQQIRDDWKVNILQI